MARIDEFAAQIVAVDGVVGVTLGGSRARGDELPTSDTDLGIYHDATLDIPGLTAVARRWAGPDTEVVAPGGWGPWVSGGAWLTVDDEPVDWLLRDIDRVAEQWARAQRGEFAFHRQFGHPLGFLDVAYAGELALGVVLADTGDRLTVLRALMRTYPPALRTAMAKVLIECEFLAMSARKALPRNDTTFISMCLTHALLLCAHALSARNERWVTTEKGLIQRAANLPIAPRDFGVRAATVVGALATPGESLQGVIDEAEILIADTRDALL